MLDDKDRKILKVLLKNSRQTSNEIFAQTGIPQTTVHNRIKKLIDKGIIQSFTVKLNNKLLDKGLSAYILCTVSYRTSIGEKLKQIDVAKKIKSLPEVEDVSIVTGENDLIIKVAVKDVDELNNFIISKLRDIEGVEKTVTSVVLSEI